MELQEAKMLSIAFTPQGLSPFEACHPPALEGLVEPLP